MKVRINGEDHSIEARTLQALVESKGFNPDSVVIEYNMQVVSKDKWDKTHLAEDDTIEVISFVGGG